MFKNYFEKNSTDNKVSNYLTYLWKHGFIIIAKKLLIGFGIVAFQIFYDEFRIILLLLRYDHLI